MPVFTDLLDGAAGQSLENRPGWSKTTGADVAALADGGSGFCLPGGTTTASGTWHAPTIQPASADQYCEGILRLANSALSCPLGVRCDISAAAGQGYLVQLDNSTGRLRLLRRSSAGALTTLGTFSVPTPADLDSNKVRLQAVGTAISVLFSGATVIGPVADALIASGSVAMLSRGGSLVSTAVARIDNWESGEVSSAPAPITGSGSATFFPMTGAGAGALMIRGAGAATFAPMTGAGTGALAIQAQGGGSFAPMNGMASGMLGAGAPITASASATFAPLIGSSTATLAIRGSASASLAPMTATARGRVGSTVPVLWLTIEADEIDLAIEAEAIPLIITLAENGARTVKTLPKKTPQAVYRVTLNMPAWITPDNPVVDLELIPVRGDVVIAEPLVVAPGRAQFWLSGGTPGKLSTFTALAHLADGQKYPQTLRVMVTETV